MKIHEYQAKETLKKYNVPVQDGIAIKSMDEFDGVIFQLKQKGISQFVVKSQIHAGGRGKGKLYNPKNPDELILEGGVKFTTSVEKAKEIASKILGNLLVTHQTGPEGKIVKTLFITEGLDYKKELYLGILLDRAVSKNVIMVSTEGGVEIEKVAAETPEKIIKEWIDPAVGLRDYQARKLAFALGLEGSAFKSFIPFIKSLYNAYEKTDASLLEINPLVITNDDKVIALDAKMNFDDNAIYRHPEIAAYRDLDEEDPLEIEASKYNLNYIKLDGNVGCMVNGAGLAMATMDIIKLAGGEPANFLDVGGGASKETVANGFKIILSDINVKAILINIFGGIVRCDRVAQGVIDAAKEMHVAVPIVVRLEGTNAKEAGILLRESGLNFEVADSFADAAKKVTAVLKK
ncbi:MAG: ADP-forming succinate--CoA ligase subunit beta [Ignavibacteriota bacterium]|nr:MAG: ADP-forming succinate--CoA ligase subunit beta [Chlorobiota bacterium]MBE7477463.1 ADP-forming succinate--CoA ligase subunit beta [Ignavibacteriales bacterium]MBL1122864.1 ADP-forming succinate--CoA ligase subunit beta [Ignavibacteriota bacterium]MBV6421486.1 Succinate--CoA ligase [ADP-forming] subunit beta [Ignavibacteriaceae bacterium]MCE7856462.1 ADP-forming succinate--CoA ligase subunit beta [Ignavibacteria bacterium CHB3]MEB2297918.1 ADP-forming succinate--CoA ligase subunit beta 